MDIFILAGCGTLFLVPGIILLYKNLQFVKGALKTTGEIVEMNEYYSTNPGRRTKMYSTTIEFYTLNNVPVRFANPSSSNIKPKIGKKVEVYYYDDKPEKAKVNSVFVLYIVPPMLIVLGLFLFFIAWTVSQG